MKNLNKNLRMGPILAFSLSLMVFLMACQSSNTTKGGGIGAGVGAALGGVIGHQSDNTVVGAIIGAAVGGTAGALIGRRMDKQAEELQKDLAGAKVERVGEGILVTFDSGLLFKHDSFGLERATKDNLSALSKTLNKYDDTSILIEGHTDGTGEDAYNLSLSQKRAREVQNFLVSQQVGNGRINTQGYGETQPLGDNTTDVGRRANRRVEVAIFANKEMKRLANKGQLGSL